MISKTN